MRLIDADAFFRNFPELAIEPYINAPTVDVEQIKSELNPTVTSWYDFDRGYEKGYEKGQKERLQGEWIVEKNQFGDILHCSICGARPRRSEYGYDLHDKFCNECGTEMKGGAE